jgi:hypothetical protein
MTLLEYVSTAALQSILGAAPPSGITHELAASEAVAYALALLKKLHEVQGSQVSQEG